MLKVTKANKLALDHGLKILVYGASGAGKTRLCTTCPDINNSLMISVESGLLSIKDSDIDVFQANSIDDMMEAYTFLAGDSHKYTWLFIDSISEVAETVLAFEKSNNKDGRKAYGNLIDRMIALVKAFRDLPGINVVMTCKQDRVQDDQMRLVFAPSCPGNSLQKELPYLFDEVLALRTNTSEDGSIDRRLQTVSTEEYTAKDRSGSLDQYEVCDLSVIYKKVHNKEK